MTTIPQPNDPTESYTATYDAWNRLVKLVDPATGHTVQENEYDGRGYRTVRKSYTAGVLTETRHFYYTDGWRDVEERLGTSPDTADPDRQFVWGLRYIDDLVLRDRSDAGTLDERLYALQDANWNVTAVVDDAGAVQERYEYDPYGQLTVLSPDFVVRMASSFGWETTYAGYRWDAASGLYAVRFRILQSRLAWVQRDPIGYAAGTTTLYGYVLSRPLTYTDPLGLIGTGDPYATCRCGVLVVDIWTHILPGSTSTIDQRQAQLTRANEILAQCCIRIRLRGTTMWSQPSYNMLMGPDLALHEWDINGTMGPSFHSHPSAQDDVMNVLFADNTPGGQAGNTFYPRPYPVILIGNAGLDLAGRPSEGTDITLAHELGHALLNTPHYSRMRQRPEPDDHAVPRNNLMAGGLVNTGEGMLTRQQCDQMREASAAILQQYGSPPPLQPAWEPAWELPWYYHPGGM